MRCSRCGNENPDGNRFCGMCGTTLLTPSAIAETVTQRAASSGTAMPPPEQPVSVLRPAVELPRPPAPEPDEPDDTPLISGPSFLGLSDPNPRKRSTLSRDSQSSRSLDYLLQDEPEEEGGGAGKIILILAVLALAAAFGYMTWKNQGVGWLTAMLSKPPAPTQTATQPENSPPSPAPTETQTPATSGSTPADNQPAPAQAQPATSPDNGKPNTPAATQPPAVATPKSDEKTSSAANPSDDGEDDAPEEKPAAPATPTAQPEKPKAAVVKPAPKPNAAVAPAKPVDTVSEAQKYLYGRGGAAQDCDRGLRLLKPAANAANPKAMIEMGALYSAGLCTPRDLPTAYRWFAIALRKEPDNEAVQKDLQKLWSEMTQPERQLAIKLTQ